MAKISYEKFVEIFNLISYEPEFEFYFDHTKETYMLIRYKDKVSFQRCGYSDEMIKEYGLPGASRGSGEIFYNSFEELYAIKAVDDICLRDEWGRISDIIVNGSFSLFNDDIEEMKWHLS